MDVASLLPALAPLPALVATALVALSGRRPAVREAWSILASLAQAGLVLAMLPAVLAGQRPVWEGPPLVPGTPLALAADPLGLLFALIASLLWVVTTVYSIGYVRALEERAQTRYFAAFALSLSATIGVALAANLLTFLLFFELLTVATYPLVVHRETAEARLAGRVYLIYTLTGGTALLGAVVWTHALAGRLDFVPGGLLAGQPPSPALLGLLALFVLGCGVKAAVVPLHTWLPLAMVAPTPVSALLHAVAVVKAGVFGLARVVAFVFGIDLMAALGGATALAWLAGATILLGSLAALAQDNLKRLLAFSTVSQLSYVVLGLCLGSPLALAGGLFHIAGHALLKITLFFCAGALHATAHVERVSEMAGIGRRMPLTMGAFTLAALLLAGLPPGAAFVSKWALLAGAGERGAWPAVAVLLASTLLNAAYFVPVILRAYRPPAAGAPAGIREASPAMLVPLLLTAAAGLALGLAPDGWLPVQTLIGAVAASAGRWP